MSQLSKASAVEANAISFYEIANTHQDPLNQVNTLAQCHKRIGHMNKEEVVELKRMLLDNLVANLPQIKQHETFDLYMRRRCQRNPARGATPARTLARMKKERKRISKKKREAKKNEEKYGKTDDAMVTDSQGEGTVELDSQVVVNKDDDQGEDIQNENYLYCGEDYSCDELESFVVNLMQDHGINVEDDKLVASELAKECEVLVKRQLGHFCEVFVDAERKRVSCTCEDYSADRYCPHCGFFEVLQFNKVPSTSCATSGERWNDIRATCIDVLKKTYVEV
jgi:hypothetical protein